MTQSDPFIEQFRGSFVSMLRWPQWDTLQETLRKNAGAGWYAYAIGETPPESPLTADQMNTFLNEIHDLLRKEHEEDYCGIVYADDAENPTFVKIYDPNNLGVTCGFSNSPPLPGWTLSLIPPCDLEHALPPPGNRKRWWKRLFQSQ
ncbi:MAG: hypothetical protein V3R49_01045 [Gammaproteobacteria bacterium]